MSIKKVAQILRGSRKVAVLSHSNPDGDAIGSALALGEALKNMGREAAVFSADPLPYVYSFLPYAREWQQVETLPPGYDTVVVLECARLERTGVAVPGHNPFPSAPASEPKLSARAPVLINIDHHLNNEKYAGANWVEENAAAVGEMIYRLLLDMKAPITPSIAANLMAAIVTDTGSFRYTSTTPSALRAAAHLVELGANLAELNDCLNQRKHLTELRLLGRVLETLQLDEECGMAWMEVTSRMLAETGGKMEETDEFAGLPRTLEKVKIAVFFKEVEPRLTKVSFRSKAGVDVARIAMKFGGGGHENAAGSKLEKSLAETKALVLAATREYLKEREKGQV